MKTFIILLSITLFAQFSFAQDYQKEIAELLKNADSDFKHITGTKKSETDGVEIFACTLKSNLGEFGDIYKDKKTGSIFYSMKIDYNFAATDFIMSLEAYFELNFPSPKFTIMSNGDDFSEEVSVFSGIEAGSNDRKQILSYFIDTDEYNPELKIFELIVYGESLQKF